MSYIYNLLSVLEGNPNVGIWYLNRDEPRGQPVRLQADLVEWLANRPVDGGGPIRLGAGPYQYTTEYKQEVFASNDLGMSREWFLAPSNCGDDTFLIATDSANTKVWTAVEPGQPIQIKPFTGEDNQLFRFIHLYNSRD